jgi:DNA repair exonuclease SbcCD ATPase subunit
MATELKCPKCGVLFPMEKGVSEEYKRDLQEKMLNYKKQKDDELRRFREEMDQKEKSLQVILQKTQHDYARKLAEERQQIRHSLEADLRKTIASDFENQISLLKEAHAQTDERLKQAREKELEYLKKEQELLTKEQELQITIQRQLLEERRSITDQIR